MEKDGYNNYFPYYAYALLLVFAQGPLSFLADYISMSKDSYFHVIDRFSATVLIGVEFLKITLMVREHIYKGRPFCRSVSLHGYVFAFVCAIMFFMKSQESQNQQDLKGFIFWHNLWHTYPLVGSFLMMLEKWNEEKVC